MGFCLNPAQPGHLYFMSNHLAQGAPVGPHADNTEGEELESGATATIALARKDKVVIANVGDSRAVLSRNGKPVDLSAEHR